MATFEKGILGGFSGKVGNVVGARWRGKNIMCSLPQRGSYVPSELQLEQREKFTVILRFLTPLKPIVGSYFGKKQGDKSVFNLATSYHMKNALALDNNEYVIEYPMVLISKGELRGLFDATVSAAADHVIDIAWSDNSGQGYANGNDQLIIAAYAEETDVYQLFIGVASRESAGASLPMPAFMAGSTVHLWASFITENGKDAATSNYLGTVTLT